MARQSKAGSEGAPSLSEYLNASNEAYSQPNVTAPANSSYPDGLTILQTRVNGKLQDVYNYDKQDGFYAVAFKTPSDQCLIAYEGTNLFTGDAQFTAGQVVDDAQIVAGQLPNAFTDALKFEKVAAAAAAAPRNNISAGNVFVTGHSLGAAECEYVSAKTGLGGDTFGTPGISTTTPGLLKTALSSADAALTNYVEIGDPVGNFAIENTGSALFPAPIPDIVSSTSPNNQHFGTTNFIGYTNTTSLLAYTSLVAANYAYQGGTEADVGAAAAAFAAAVPDHFLTEYAYDLGVTLGSADHSYGANLACFAQGTRISTTRGNVAVEALAIGDRVVTASGAHRPVRWLGHREVDCRRHPRPREVLPVRVAAGAFGGDRPARDLYVSPGHSICVDTVGEVLIPAGALVNGSTIQQIEMDEVTYWHVELDRHDILLADNLPAESYLDMGNRSFFKEADVVDLAASPDSDPSLRTHADFCRPFYASGTIVDAVRARLNASAAASLEQKAARAA